jgi:hypothetical protein
MNKREICGEPTPNGPCNMRKGHEARFHRHRNHNHAIEWQIVNPVNKIISQGRGRNDLGYALTKVLRDPIYDKFTIVIEK